MVSTKQSRCANAYFHHITGRDLADPLADRLGGGTELGGHRGDRRPRRGIVGPGLRYQADRSGALLRREPARTLTSLHLLNGFGQVAAVAGLPLVVCLDQHRAGEAEQCRLVGEDADHVGPALDLLVQPLQRVGAPQLLPVGWREVGELGDVGLASSSIAATVGNWVPAAEPQFLAIDRQAVAVLRGVPVDRRTLRHDAGRIDRLVGGVVVPLDVFEVRRLPKRRPRVELARVAP